VSRDDRDSPLERFDLHLSESQRVMIAFPVYPVHTVSERVVSTSQVTTVEVGVMTIITVPPGTVEHYCT